MLIDDVIITVKAGDGGDGAVSFKRNAQTAKGGPDGGNGGNGGDIYLQASINISDLSQFSYKKLAKAESGISGKKKNLYGRNGKDLTVYLPLGTRITDKSTAAEYELNDAATKILIAKGGSGGKGNNEFKTATNQTPRYAEKGGKGEIKKIHLELRLIAQIGLIGLPNAGKSSLLDALTNARPKIGNYPFTTTQPNLGVLYNLVLADIPGIIEGASKGKGLGFQFLRHIEKTRLLLHCIDATCENAFVAYQIIRKEFEVYGHDLETKPEVILLTKTDLIDTDTLTDHKKTLAKTKRKIIPVSIYNPSSLKEIETLIQENIKKTE
ncbi:MAG: GTPase ObgE [Candidatus Levybacteria bacterium]|nr:GTPase ObgE [Candidatus Levybacteria bacterium]